MQKLVELAQNIADSTMTVLLTGKFVPVNAAAIPDAMVEAELFGHTRGAFTGAEKARTGLLEAAHEGTFYLNEIADATPALQAKLLEVLETREVRRLGENVGRKVNFRLIAATNHNLQKDIDDGRFRLDLYHRLREISLVLPPLTERPEDIEPLVAHFMSELGVNSGDNGGRGEISRLATILTGLPWPGNVRELRSRIRQLCSVTEGKVERMIERLLDAGGQDHGLILAGVLKQTGWNRSETARIFGVSEGTVRNWIARYSITE